MFRLFRLGNVGMLISGTPASILASYNPLCIANWVDKSLLSNTSSLFLLNPLNSPVLYFAVTTSFWFSTTPAASNNSTALAVDDKSFLPIISSLYTSTVFEYGVLLLYWTSLSDFVARFCPASVLEPNSFFLTAPFAPSITLPKTAFLICCGVPFTFCAKNLPTKLPAPSFLISARTLIVSGSSLLLNLPLVAILVGISFCGNSIPNLDAKLVAAVSNLFRAFPTKPASGNSPLFDADFIASNTLVVLCVILPISVPYITASDAALIILIPVTSPSNKVSVNLLDKFLLATFAAANPVAFNNGDGPDIGFSFLKSLTSYATSAVCPTNGPWLSGCVWKSSNIVLPIVIS